MGLEISRLLGFAGVNQNYHITPTVHKGYVSFGQNVDGDTFQSTTINRYTSERAIIDMIKANPEIIKTLKKESVPLKVNISGLKQVLNTHGTDTKNIAAGIINNLPFSLKEKVNEKSVVEAAYLHDIGKVLIPQEILYKEGKLSPKETNIMHLHSELGYQLLRTTDIDTATLNLIRYHHQNQLKNGYPAAGNDFNADLNQQIVSVADKYSALREERSYKDRMSKEQALTIIYRDVEDGKLHPFIFKALVDYANSAEAVQKTAKV